MSDQLEGVEWHELGLVDKFNYILALVIAYLAQKGYPFSRSFDPEEGWDLD